MKCEENNTIQERRLQALEMIHAISTAFHVNSDTIYDLTVLAINDILKSSYVMIYEFIYGNIVLKSKNSPTGSFNDDECSTCSACIKKDIRTVKKPLELWQHQLLLKNNCKLYETTESIIRAPIIDTDGIIIGMICIIGALEERYNENDIHFIDLFARFLSNEMTRKKDTESNQRKFEQDLVLQLASGITHEVRNRLNSISVNAEALLSNVGDIPDLFVFQENIKQQTNSLSSTMDDFMSLGQPISSEQLSEVSLGAMVFESLLFWQKSTSEKVQKVKVTLNLSENVIIKADVLKLRHAISNMLTNAHNLTLDNSEIHLSVVLGKRQWVHIRVANSGRAIPEDQLSRVFEPFYFSAKSGNGLCLSIVKHIAECHGGSVSMFINKIPSGLTVELNLPVV